MQGAFECAPDLRPDFSGLTRAKLPIVVLALLNTGLSDVDAYLDDHGSPFTYDDLLKVIDTYKTTARVASGSFNGLWRRLGDGSLKSDLAITR